MGRRYIYTGPPGTAPTSVTLNGPDYHAELIALGFEPADEITPGAVTVASPVVDPMPDAATNPK